MTRRITPQTTLDNLKKEAKRWLKELRANEAEARAVSNARPPKFPATRCCAMCSTRWRWNMDCPVGRR